MKYFIIAGEASGDLHGSNLIKGLKQADPQCQIRCWGGDLMKEAGGELVSHYKDTAVMGFFEVLMKIGKIFRNFRKCHKDILDFNPDVVVLIDYPGFNFRIAKFAKKRGFKVFYYIAPKIWAWKESRGKRLKKYVDRLFIIFPFEIEYFKNRWQIDAIYRGNPLLDSIESNKYMKEDRQTFVGRLSEITGNDYSTNDKFIALLAGSRRTEISYQLPVMLDTVRAFPSYKFILAAAPSIPEEFYGKLIKKYCTKNGIDPSEISLPAVYGQTYPIMKNSQAAIVNSGTASLEAALIGVPQMVSYLGSEISYIIAKQLIKGIKYISLANLILDKLIFKEFIQHEANLENISAELRKLLEDTQYIQAMKADYAEVHKLLGGGGASKAVAEAMVEEYGKLKES
ncbi:MAG: lipid-A-disaccharide synthase [Bacteroidales bacterium]|jgi:lipid-A-disaccharide synthase|nr:lipid-A-disaccharide synthase [Bacteroidales bacterium]